MSMETLTYPAIAVASFLAYKGYKAFETPKELESIPKIPLIPVVVSILKGESFDLQFDRLFKPELEKLGYARIWGGGKWEIIVTSQKDSREVMGYSDTFLKQPENQSLIDYRMLISKFFGYSNIGMTDGQEWRRHRRIANPAFKKNWKTDSFGECTDELIEKLMETNQEPIVIHSLFQRLTLDALGSGLFSYNFEAVKKGDSSRYLKIYTEIMEVVFNPLYLAFPILEDWIPSRRYYHRQSQVFRDFLMNIITERKFELERGIIKDDLLSSIIKASMDEMDDKAKLNDEEVLNNLAGFFLAGHDTTANTLTGTFYFLAKYPEIQERARQEVLEILGESDTTITPTTEQIKEMDYLGCIIKESMRSITTSTQVKRYCNTTTTLTSGLIIPANSAVMVHLWAVHHDPEIFPNPDHFDPDRFKDPLSSQSKAWMAFGTGSRMCLGLNFSLIEQKVVMSMLLQKFNILPGPQSQSSTRPTLNNTGLTHPIEMDLQFIPRI